MLRVEHAVGVDAVLEARDTDDPLRDSLVELDHHLDEIDEAVHTRGHRPATFGQLLHRCPGQGSDHVRFGSLEVPYRNAHVRTE
jgi:hypothetical protein